MDPEVKKLRKEFDAFVKAAVKRKLVSRVEALEKRVKVVEHGKADKPKKTPPGHNK